ncbi:MAG: hypothetical protein IPQ16_14535 [Geobacteraceae bacterium]|nr:hypothetical protein [Geobacteraceae bacterium]
MLKQVSIDRLSIVQECPFEAALRKCYEIGIESGKKWMVTVDADVLLSHGSIASLLFAAEQMPGNYFQLEGRIYDKITGIYRQAGHRIYRTEYLKKAINLIPKDATQIRPEYFTLQQMGQLGYLSRRVANVVGLHDFEQYYGDYYRKAFIHAVKHKWHVNSYIERCARYHQDVDFLVILKGLCDGLESNDNVSIDKSKFIVKSRVALDEMGIIEKEPINNTKSFVHNFESNYAETVSKYSIPDFQTQDETVFPVADESCFGWYNKTKLNFERLGPINGSVSLVGKLLKHIGQYLDR